jgi:Kef-type K+ transport system membrane component KefB
MIENILLLSLLFLCIGIYLDNPLMVTVSVVVGLITGILVIIKKLNEKK